MNNAREDALEIFLYALKASRVEPAMERRLRFNDGVMEIDGHRYVLREYGRCLVVAIGKAAHALVSSFLRQAGNDAERFEGIVVGAETGEALPLAFRVYHGGHPSPNEASVAAAADVLRDAWIADGEGSCCLPDKWWRVCDAGAVFAAGLAAGDDCCDAQGAG